MTQPEIGVLLNSIDIKATYGKSLEDVTLPYIYYKRVFDNPISSDFDVHGVWKNYQIELYTEDKDEVAERKLEDVLKQINSTYQTTELWLEDENMYQVIYDIKTLEMR